MEAGLFLEQVGNQRVAGVIGGGVVPPPDGVRHVDGGLDHTVPR